MKIFVNKSRGMLHYIIGDVLYPFKIAAHRKVLSKKELENSYGGGHYLEYNKYFRQITTEQLQEIINENIH